MRNLEPQDTSKRDEIQARKQRIARLGDAAHWWAYSLIAFAVVAHFRRRSRFDLPDASGEQAKHGGEGKADANQDPVAVAEPAVMGGTLLRTLALGFTLWHCSAVAALFIPDYPLTQAWRSDAQKVFGQWIQGTNQQQSWKMFAPNPPRSNTFMQTLVVDQDGEAYLVGTDHYTNRPRVFWYNDRSRKMHRRMIGKSKWYLRYWGQYHCRDWAINNDGQLPKEVRVFKLRTGIPSPEELAEAGEPSDPRERKLRRELIETHYCEPDVLTPEVKERRGWALTDADERLLDNRPRRAELEAERKRASWAKRKDFGGKGEVEDEDKAKDEDDD